MKNLLKILFVFVFVAYLTLAAGCSSSHRNRSRHAVDNRNETDVTVYGDPFEVIAEQNYHNQQRSDRRHKESLEYWEGFGDRMDKTKKKFRNNVLNTTSLKRRDHGGFFKSW